MTLAIGDKVVKIDKSTGQPSTEGHAEFEVVHLGTYGAGPMLEDGSFAMVQEVKLRVIR